MAEYAEANLEACLPEVKIIKKMAILNDNEIVGLLKRRRKLEYALLKQQRSPNDFLNYIEHEKSLLLLVRYKRKFIDNDLRVQVNKIEKSISDRLIRLHRQLCYRFQSSVCHWLAFIRLLSNLKRHPAAERVWKRFLAVHNCTDVTLWVGAHNWVLHERLPAQLKYIGHRKRALLRSFQRGGDDPGAEDTDRVQRSRVNRQIYASVQSLNRQRLTPWSRVFADARYFLLAGLDFHPDHWRLRLELVRSRLKEWHFFCKTSVGRRLIKLLTKAQLNSLQLEIESSGAASQDSRRAELELGCVQEMLRCVKEGVKGGRPVQERLLLRSRLREDLLINCPAFLSTAAFRDSQLPQLMDISGEVTTGEKKSSSLPLKIAENVCVEFLQFDEDLNDL